MKIEESCDMESNSPVLGGRNLEGLDLSSGVTAANPGMHDLHSSTPAIADQDGISISTWGGMEAGSTNSAINPIYVDMLRNSKSQATWYKPPDWAPLNGSLVWMLKVGRGVCSSCLATRE